MENKCVICGGPVGENAIPSRTLDGEVCLESAFPATPCEFLDKAFSAAGRLKSALEDIVMDFEDKCSVSTAYNIRRNGGLRPLDCGHLPAIRAAISNLQCVLDTALNNPGGPDVQE